MENLRPLRAELPAMSSDISNAMRGFKDHSLHMLVLDEVLGLELSNFSRQLKLKPGNNDDSCDFQRLVVPRNGDKRGRREKKEPQRDRGSLGSNGLAIETRGQQVAALDSSDSRSGHGRFRASLSDDHEDSCLSGERSEPGREGRGKVSRICEQSVPSDP